MKAPDFQTLKPGFLDRWGAWYPDAPPVGFLLRIAYPERWLRIHALRGDKRIPASGWDYAELLRRFNTMAGVVLGDRSSCALIVMHECDATLSGSTDDYGAAPESLTHVGMLPEELWEKDEGVFVVPMCLSGAVTTWAPGLFDQFFTAAAHDRLSGLLVEMRRGQVFAPYDGGADLFFATSWERDQAKEGYAAWLSSRADGL